MKIRTQIFLLFGTFFVGLIAALFSLNLILVRTKLRTQAKQDLIKLHEQVVNSAEALLSTAIDTYLRGITETEMETVRYYYAQYKSGKMSEQDAKDAVQKHLSLKKVGETGYMAAIQRRENRLYLEFHPIQRGVDCSETEGCLAWNSVSNGLVEYGWQNPEDSSMRMKVAYVQEFEPWNMIVGASSYKDEFVTLVDLSELKRMIKPIRILETGYFYVMDLERDLFLIHPELEGVNPSKMYGIDGERITDKLLKSSDGWTDYLWKNPSEKRYRQKYSYITKLDWYNWHIVSSGYTEEIFAPIAFLGRITAGISLGAIAVLILLVSLFSRIITGPLEQIQKGIISFYTSQKPFRWKRKAVSEIAYLGKEVSEMTESISKLIAENRGSLSSLDQIINVLPSVIATIDRNGKILLCNDIFRESVGYDDTMKESTIFELLPELLPYRDRVQESFANCRVDTVTYKITGVNVVQDRELTILPLIEDVTEKALIRIDDITQRLLMERQVHQSQKMEAVGQLAGGIAHDFNNVLAGIVGAAEMLSDSEGITEDQKELTDLILTATDRAAGLTRKLLTFSRRGTANNEAVDGAEIINEAVALLRHTLDKSIEISVQNNAALTTILGDKSNIQNVFMNIGINASHAMPNGGKLTFTAANIELDSEYCEHSQFNIEAGKYLEISIRDTGYGMEPETQSHIFEPFFTTKKEGKGTGLGLAAVYGIIQEHRGAITVYSELNSGTVFHIYFPINGDLVSKEEIAAPIPRGTETVLVIDDEELIRATASALLTSMGYTVILAENGQEGLETFRENRDLIDLIILDMIMPVMGGRETFGKLREINGDIPIIISSGFAKEKDLAELEKQNVSAFLHKPFRKIQMAETMKQVLHP